MMLNKTFYLLLLSLIPIFGFSQANSQYPDSGNKIRLGFQTTGDGLIWRDTQPNVGIYQPINNKAAWIILDTMNNKFYHYKNSTWTLAGGQDIDTANLIATQYDLGLKLSLADTQNMLTPYWRSGRFSGVLPVANGGTGSATQNFVDLTTTQSIGGVKTFTSELTATRFNPTANTATGTGMFLPATNTLGFSTAGENRLQIGSNGRVGIGTTTLVGILNIKQVGSELSIQTDANNVYFEGINRENTALSVDYGFYARNGNHRFWTGQYTERMTILNNGNVGIGTTSPSEKLVVAGAIMSTSGITGHGANRTTISQEGANGAFWQSYGANTSTAGIFQLRQASSDFSIQRVPLYIDASGNVGIGTIGPNARLQVNGSSSASEFALKINDVSNNNLLSVQNNGNVGIRTTAPTSLFHILTGSQSPSASGNMTTGAIVQSIGGGNALNFGAFNGATIAESHSWIKSAYHNNSETYTSLALQPQGGNVGIGTTSPQSRLNVAGAKTNSADLTTITNQLAVTDITATAAGVGGRISFLGAYTATPDYFTFGSIEVLKDNANNYGSAGWNNAAMRFIVGNNDNDATAGRMLERMRITSGGNVIINSLTTNGIVYSNAGTLTNTNPSDSTLKNSINPYTYGLSEILQLKPKTFYYNLDVTRSHLKYGFIAQEVQSIMPNLVRIIGNGSDKLGLESEGIYVAMVNAIKELSAEIDILKQEIINLKNK